MEPWLKHKRVRSACGGDIFPELLLNDKLQYVKWILHPAIGYILVFKH